MVQENSNDLQESLLKNLSGKSLNEATSPSPPLILFLDDEEDFLELLQRSIPRRYKWNLVFFDRTAEALDFLREHPADLIFSDIFLEDEEIDGIAFLEEARTLAPEALQILLSGYAAKDKLIRAINRLDLYSFLEKPFEPDQLLLIIRNGLEQRRLQQDLQQKIAKLEEQNQQLASTQQDLIRQKKQAVIGELIQGVCHNLNTPLNLILGNVDLLGKHLKSWERKSKSARVPIPKWRHFLRAILGSAEKIELIIHNMMIKSRMDQEPSLQLVSLNELIERETQFLQADSFFRNQVQTTVVLNPEVPEVWLNYGDFSQIVNNLTRNALDALHNREAPRLHFETSFEGENISLSICDNGCGVPEEIRERIFDPFFTTKKPLESEEEGPTGTGLGLYSVLGLLEPYGGKIEVSDSPWGGACFTISLPFKKLSNAPSSSSNKQQSPESPPPPTSPTTQNKQKTP